MTQELTHVRSDGTVTMVDVGNKPISKRKALAEGYLEVSQKTFDCIKHQALPKGDALACARIAGILGAKQTSSLIPLCHPLPITFVDVRIELLDQKIRVESEVHCNGETGVEMEALMACHIALATLYDMCKAVQKDMVITNIRLLHKSGGVRGTYTAEGFSL